MPAGLRSACFLDVTCSQYRLRPEKEGGHMGAGLTARRRRSAGGYYPEWAVRSECGKIRDDSMTLGLCLPRFKNRPMKTTDYQGVPRTRKNIQ
jgi:hypothetical protein